MHRPSCIDTFNSKQLERIARPLRCGIYKLEETTSNLKEWLLEIERVRINRSTKGSIHANHSTYRDSHTWLKQTPEYVAELLGHDVEPAIAALTGDGVPRKITQHIGSMYGQKIQSLVELCDSFFDSVNPKANAKEMHTEMVYQKLSILVREAIDITEGILINSKLNPINHPLHRCSE